MQRCITKRQTNASLSPSLPSQKHMQIPLPRVSSHSSIPIFIYRKWYLYDHFLTTLSHIHIIFLSSLFLFSSLFFWTKKKEKIKVVIKIVIYDCINITLFIYFSPLCFLHTIFCGPHFYLPMFFCCFLPWPNFLVIIIVLNPNPNNPMR